MNKIIVNAVLYGIILNVVGSLVFAQFATQHEIKPPNGAQNLGIKNQIMHMFVHHKQVLFSSSLIIAFLIAVAVGLAKKVPLIK